MKMSVKKDSEASSRPKKIVTSTESFASPTVYGETFRTRPTSAAKNEFVPADQ